MPEQSSFDAAAARRLREALGMRPADVAHGMWAAYGLRVPPETVAGWERGDAAPGTAELTALTGALWCAPAELLRSPQTLHQHRLARGLAAADVARMTGMPAGAYEEAERTGTWHGDDRQTAALGAALQLPPATLLELTGRSGRLTAVLREAVTTRWQAHAGRVAALVPLPRPRVEAALRRLHRDYQSTATGALSWTGGAAADGSAGADFLAGVLTRFWELTEEP